MAPPRIAGTSQARIALGTGPRMAPFGQEQTPTAGGPRTGTGLRLDGGRAPAGAAPGGGSFGREQGPHHVGRATAQFFFSRVDR